MQLGDLNTLGWALVKGVSSRSELLELGSALGCPELTPNGEMIKEIRVMPAAEAPLGSQSSTYGTGPFPLHTDTVFWPVPVRYVILRAYGDMRRPTTVMSFSDLLQGCDTRLSALIDQSIWLTGTRSKRFYCSLRFRHGDAVGWRYDGDLMSPVNDAAVEVGKVLRPLTAGVRANCVDWCADVALVLSNWSVLHGRGPEPPEEGNRIIERLYVR